MKKKIIYIGIAVLIVAVVIISACLLLNNSNNNDQEDPQKKSTYTLTFDSRGGSDVSKQKVKQGELADYPMFPTREGYLFVGWYTNENYDERFDFSAPITKSHKLVARWIDIANTVDTDADGLPDAVEEYYNTDVAKADTDDDGVNDYWEILLNLDPLNSDTNQNGVKDSDEDFDSDLISNSKEIDLGTNPVLSDTDGDGLADGEEINVYNTDALSEDTDEDGAYDGWEINNQFDPCRYNRVFNIKVAVDSTDNSGIVASVEMYANGRQAVSLSVEPVDMEENALLSDSIPGYMGQAYEFYTCEEISSAVITFEYSTDMGTLGREFQPRIYYFNEEENILEELRNQTVTNGKVSVRVSHFSKYVLLNKYLYDLAWDTDILDPYTAMQNGVNITLDSDDDGIADYYSSLIKEGKLLSSTGQNFFAGIDFSVNADYDNDGLLNGEELLVINQGGFCGRVYYILKSNPLSVDSDYDGFPDGEDPTPMKWNISYRDLALLGKASYYDISVNTYFSSLRKENEIMFSDKKQLIVGQLNELIGWKVIKVADDSLSGFQAAVYAKDNNIVLAFRGTEFELGQVVQDFIVADGAAYALGLNPQLPHLNNFVKKVCKEFGDKYTNIYVVGHSLGGYLATMAADELVDRGFEDKIRKVVTFNGLGLNYIGAIDIIFGNVNKISNRIVNYETHKDVVSPLGSYKPGTTFDVQCCSIANCGNIFDEHALTNFIARFSNEIRHPIYGVTWYGLNDELKEGSDDSGSGDTGDDHQIVIDTPYYTVEVPQNWLGKFVSELYTEDDGTYHLSIREKISAEYGYVGEIFTLYMLKDGEEFYNPNSYIIKTFLKDGEKYNIWVITSTDFDVAYDGVQNYQLLCDTMSYVLETIKLKDMVTDVTSDDNSSWEDVEGFPWSFDESTGTITMSGKGAMPNYHCDYDPAPWDYLFYSDLVKHIVIEDGITSIGSFTCWGASESVTIPKSVTSIEFAAFDCSSVKTIYYYGTKKDWNNIYIVSQGNDVLNNVNIVFLG